MVGLGLRLGHVTREVETVLGGCGHVYYLHSDPEVVRFLEGCSPSLTDLSTFYLAGTSRLETYYSIAARVISHASQCPPVGVALYGHPTVFSTLSGMLIAGSRQFGVDTAVYPGISSIDAILAEFGLDPGQVALQVHEATELLIFDRPLDPHSGLLIFQAGQLETRIHTTEPSSPERLRQLVDRLTATYGPSHEVTAMEARGVGTGWTWRGSLAKLASAAPEFGLMFTIYIPPAARPPIRDAAVLGALDDVAQLDRLVG
jgi:tetrapyrrole methylase family protein/MazG family protein